MIDMNTQIELEMELVKIVDKACSKMIKSMVNAAADPSAVNRACAKVDRKALMLILNVVDRAKSGSDKSR